MANRVLIKVPGRMTIVRSAMDFMLKRMLEFVYWLRLNKAHKQGNSSRTVTFACDCNALGIFGQLDILSHISLCDQVIYLEVNSN
jgi:hypothetical protein